MQTLKQSDLDDPDANADWIKKIDGGKYQKADIAAGEAALAAHQKKQGKKSLLSFETIEDILNKVPIKRIF